jgi:Protein of unknown function (DUF2934)
VATKKNSSSPGTTRSRTKKTVDPTNETTASTTETPLSSASGGTAVAPAREKTTTTTTGPASTRPNFNYPSDVQKRIRQRAYELFQQRGGQHGFDVQDWLRAEAEMTRR